MRPWTGHCVVADSYQQGRVFLAGDAAHLNWPAGGFGMNTGVGDAVDIGWKLAAVLQGWGGKNLLNSYTAERKPIAMINVNEAAEMRANFDNQTPFSPKISEDSDDGKTLREKAHAAIMRTRAKEFQHDSAGIELGLSLRELADLRRRRHACTRTRSRPLRPVHLARRPRAARLAQRRPLDPRSLTARVLSW